MMADACGCAMSARFLGVGLVGGFGWYLWHWPAWSFWSALWCVLLAGFAAALAGKIVGIMVFKFRHDLKKQKFFGSFFQKRTASS
jgi:ABC-type branched-subunit amino acid transport system permease subunit